MFNQTQEQKNRLKLRKTILKKKPSDIAMLDALKKQKKPHEKIVKENLNVKIEKIIISQLSTANEVDLSLIESYSKRYNKNLYPCSLLPTITDTTNQDSCIKKSQGNNNSKSSLERVKDYPVDISSVMNTHSNTIDLLVYDEQNLTSRSIKTDKIELINRFKYYKSPFLQKFKDNIKNQGNKTTFGTSKSIDTNRNFNTSIDNPNTSQIIDYHPLNFEKIPNGKATNKKVTKEQILIDGKNNSLKKEQLYRNDYLNLKKDRIQHFNKKLDDIRKIKSFSKNQRNELFSNTRIDKSWTQSKNNSASFDWEKSRSTYDDRKLFDDVLDIHKISIAYHDITKTDPCN